MKDRRYANRGVPFETFIKLANQRYRQKGEAFIEKQYTEFIPLRNSYGRVCDVKVEHKATVDFIGRYKQYPIAIEAKHTSTDTIKLNALQENQVDDMHEFCSCPGTIGLVLVSFKMDTFFAIPWAFWGAAYDIRIRDGNIKAPASVYAFGEEWTIPTKKSLRIEDMSPLWRVSGRDYGYGLNYLQKAENYVISL